MKYSFITGTNPISVAAGDFNADGKPDLAVANENASTVSVLINSTVPPVTLGNYPAATVNLSGNTTVTPSAAPTGATSLNVSTSTNFKGTFAANPATGVVRVTDAHPAGTYTVTVNASGTTKTFTLTVTTTSAACTGITFSSTSRDVGARQWGVAVGDFNGDGIQDLATANAISLNVSVLIGTGGGNFAAATTFAAGLEPRSIAVGDFNGDGKQDLAVSNSNSNNVSVHLGTGTGSFGAATNLPVGTNPWWVVAGDFNGDGIQDLATANQSSNNTSVLLGTGTGSFAAATNFALSPGSLGLAVGDFNADGLQDLVVTNFTLHTTSIRLRTCLAPEIDVRGGTPLISIADGDTTPATADGTDFGSTAVTGGSVTRTFTIANTGTAALNLTGTPRVAVSGTNASDFTVTVQPASPVAATSGTTTFTVVFDPSATGLRTAALSIAHNDTNENPYNFSIQGNGGATSTVSVICPGAPQTYTGSALTPCTASYSTSDGLSGSLTVSYTNNINVGTAGASATYAGDAGHQGSSGSSSFAIGMASSSVTVTCTAGAPYTYTGSAQTPCTASYSGAGGLSGSLTVSYTNNTNAGTAGASASYDGDANHTGSSGSGSFVIAVKSATWTTNANSKIFGSSDPIPLTTGSGSGFIPADGVTATYSRVAGGTVGTYHITATLTPTGALANYSITNAGATFTIGAWTLNGFYQPIGIPNTYNILIPPMAGITWNSIKGGQTVPLKFNIFAGATEQTNVSAVAGFTVQQVTCVDVGTSLDDVDFVTTGATILRYDGTPGSGGQFIQNWKTPATVNLCYRTVMTATDGSVLVAFFKTKK